MKSITLTDDNGKELKIEIEEFNNHGDGYFYFSGKDQDGELMHFRIKHEHAEHIIDKAL
jgi:hypothetical protein